MKQDSVVSFSYIWILFSKISINRFIIKPLFKRFQVNLTEPYTSLSIGSLEEWRKNG